MADENSEFGGLSWDVAKLMGFGRARAVAVGRRTKLGKPLPNDPLIIDDDFRCDAEQVEVGKSGRITKSPPPEITKLNGT
jgi:hypothetical protein